MRTSPMGNAASGAWPPAGRFGGRVFLPLALGLALAVAAGAGNLSGAEPGVTDKEIVLGTHAPLSGPAAEYGAVAKAVGAYFAYVNDQGGVNGRRIRLFIRDDGFLPELAEQAARQLVTRERVLALVGGFGDAPHLRVADFLNAEGVPDLFPTGGTARWSDPLRRWTFAFQPTYRQEGRALALLAARDYASKRAAILALAGEFGQEGAMAFREGAQNRVRIVGDLRLAATETAMEEPVRTLRGAGAEVVVLFTLPGTAARFMAAATRAGWRPAYLLPSFSSVPEVIRDAGPPAAEGAIGLGFLPLPEESGDGRVRRHQEILRKYAPEVPFGRLSLYGQALAELTVEILRRAGPQPTRASLVAAAETLSGWNDQGQALVREASLSAGDHRALHALRTVVVQNGRWVPGRTWLDVP